MPKIRNRCVEVQEGGVGGKGWEKGDKGGRQEMGRKRAAERRERKEVDIDC